jgi:predicted membrane chloride channel (bestrophin family)
MVWTGLLLVLAAWTVFSTASLLRNVERSFGVRSALLRLTSLVGCDDITGRLYDRRHRYFEPSA